MIDEPSVQPAPEELPQSDSDQPVSLPTDLDAVRDLILQAHPDVVPELVVGDTVADIIASVEPARAAFANLAERLQATQPAVRIPGGGGQPLPVNPSTLPPVEKIRRGIRQQY